MLTILISIIIIFFILKRDKKIAKSEESYWMITLKSILMGLVFGLFIGFLLPADTIEEKYSVYIENLQDNSAIHGSFFLGSGTVDGVWKYTYYVKRGNSYYIESINASGVPIRYTDGRPRIEYTRNLMKEDNWINLFAIPFAGCGSFQVIYIPKGSIKQNYNLDAL